MSAYSYIGVCREQIAEHRRCHKSSWNPMGNWSAAIDGWEEAVNALDAIQKSQREATETHEQRWAKLGWPFKWSDEYRAYVLPDPNFPNIKDKVRLFSWCNTIAEVDAWIDAHYPVGG